jgi:hypothetical protein
MVPLLINKLCPRLKPLQSVPTHPFRAMPSPSRPLFQTRYEEAAFEDAFTVGGSIHGRRSWSCTHVLFVLWYNLTTTLSLNTIANCFNATFTPYQRMDVADVQNIITELFTRFNERGRVFGLVQRLPKPKQPGWYPCDHGKVCQRSGSSNGGRNTKSVARGCKTRTDRAMAEMAMQIWNEPWVTLCTCPRHNHAEHADTVNVNIPFQLCPQLRQCLAFAMVKFALFLKETLACVMFFLLIETYFTTIEK